MDYKKKYIKYKLKYINLKNQHGGSEETVKDLWILIINSAKTLKEDYLNFDGLTYWNKIKPYLEEVDSSTTGVIEWNKNHDKIFDQFTEVFELIPEKDDNGKLIEKNHFLLQQLNIPKKDEGKPSFRRLLQIALNIGQLQSYQDLFDEKINILIKENKLSEIDTYMTPYNYSKYNFSKEKLNQLILVLGKLNLDPPLVN